MGDDQALYAVLERGELREGERWSGFDRALGGGAYFGASTPIEATALDAA